jgi:hypothetical protein
MAITADERLSAKACKHVAIAALTATQSGTVNWWTPVKLATYWRDVSELATLATREALDPRVICQAEGLVGEAIEALELDVFYFMNYVDPEWKLAHDLPHGLMERCNYGAELLAHHKAKEIRPSILASAGKLGCEAILLLAKELRHATGEHHLADLA